MTQRIAVVTTSYPSAGDDVSGHFVRSEVRRLVAEGNRVTVLCPGGQRPHRQSSTKCLSSDGTSMLDDDATVVRLGAGRVFGWPGAVAKLRRNPLAALSLPAFIRRARARLRDGNFDRIIAHWLLGSGWPIAAGVSVPVEIVVHGSDARILARLGPLRHYILGTLERQGCSLRLVAPHLEPLLRTATNGAWLARARVEPLPVSIPPLAPRETLRRELGVPEGAHLGVFVGRLVASKRLDVALRRAPLPRDAMRVVVGSGPLASTLKHAFPDVHFTGQLDRERTLKWLKAADVVISASLEEGAPTALREARLVGTPVWTAEFGSASTWAASDPGVKVTPELTASWEHESP